MVEEGYINLETGNPQMPGAHLRRHRPGQDRRGEAGRPARPVQPDPEGHGLSGLPGAEGPSVRARQGGGRLARHAAPRDRRRGRRRVQAVRVRRLDEPGHPGDAQERHRAGGAEGPARSRLRRPHGAPGRVPVVVRHRAAARHLALDGALRRGPVRSGQARGARALAPDPHAVPGRLAARGHLRRPGARRSRSRSSPRRRSGRSTPTRPRASRSGGGSCRRRRRTCGRSS